MASRPVTEYIENMCPRLFANPGMDMYIELATDRTNLAYFGDNLYNYAIALRAMHDYTIDATRSRGEAGFITDRTEGRLTVRYLHNMSRESRNDLMMTSYGQKLHSLIRSRGPIAGIAVADLDLNTGILVDSEGM
jgi:hypothetical protein